MNACSTRYAGAFTLEPRPSRILAVWRAALAGLLATAAATLGVPWPARLVLAAVACGLTVGCARRRRFGVIRVGGGRWSVPSGGPGGELFQAQYSSWWVELRSDAPGRPAGVVLLRDQLDAEDWRRLQLAVREAGPDGA